MAAAMIHQPWLFGCIPPLLLQPAGLYGISYDIFQLPSEKPVPDGWESHRSRTYSELIKRLRESGYVQHQYSDYRDVDTTAFFAFRTAITLTHIRPPNKLSTTVRGLKIHYISDLNLLDVTDAVMLGGPAALHLGGRPAPRQLVHNLVAAGANPVPPPVPLLPGHHALPPFATRRNDRTQNPANYVR